MVAFVSPCRSRRSSASRAAACALAVVMLLGGAPPAAAQQGGGVSTAPPTDVGWPRQVKDGSSTITVYQPQVDSWDGNLVKSRAAVSVATPASPTPTFGVVWFTARTDVDKQARVVTLHDIALTRASFPTEPAQKAEWLQTLRSAVPKGVLTIALDRLEANLEVTRATQGTSGGVQVQNSPPRIIVSEKPAILVLVDGTPVLRQVDGSATLLHVINTRALLVLDQSSGAYYLYTMNRWATASSLDGSWTPVAAPPAGLDAVKETATQQGHVDLLSDPPGQAKSELQEGVLPELYVATGPAELLQTDGPPQYQPIASTQLLDVTNTSGDIFLDTTSQTYYVLVSGRWFSASSLTQGPWAFVPPDRLPADFARIPFDHPKGTVLTSVAGTPQAQEAAISVNVPQTATVQRSSASMPPPQFDGAPQLQPIDGTSLRYVANTATPIIEVAPSQYFAVLNGVWFTGTTPTGPWVVADAVPPAIYTIPPSSPLYYVTYVRVYGATPDVVYVGYTPGYYGTYVVPAGTVVYGTGFVYQPWVGSVWIGPPYTYGFGASYVWGAATGFALGATAGAFCHPWWGPAGWGWGGGTVAYNRTVNVNNMNVYTRWGGGAVVNDGNHYAGRVGNTTYLGNAGGDVYADRDGNVYRRQDGGWQKYGNDGWNDVQRPNAADAANAPGAGRAQDAARQDPNMPGRDTLAGPGGADPSRGGAGTLGELPGRAGAARADGGYDRGVGVSQDDAEGNLDRDFQARQVGDQRWNSFQQAGDRSGARDFGGGDRFGGSGLAGGDRFGGGFRGGFGGGFRGGRR
ncbi:MAG: autotransporter [Deltaproteobacteria bacterium]|nr:autotransporter [Deltaproteobacteria bacterium]